MKKKTFLQIILFTVSLMFCVTGCKKNNVATDETENTDQATESSTETSVDTLTSFTCETIDGGTFTEADFANKDLTIINFWMTTCQPCIREIPQLEEIKNSLPDNVQMVLVSLDDSYYIDDVREIIEQTGFSGTVMMCGDKDMEDLAKTLLYVPTTLFFDSQGNRVGSTMVGSPENIEESYTTTINDILTDMGKESEWKK
ncbi:MAG: TlpA family protein disulfide reductase [Lachnospiraceae bacterium]